MENSTKDSDTQFAFPILNGDTFLDDKEYKLVEVLFSQLIPANHKLGIPGAIDANATLFLSRLLAIDESQYYKIKDWKTSYREGLPLMNKAAMDELHKPLEELNEKEITHLLKLLQQESLKNFPDNFGQKKFFAMLLEHCIKGCFSDPRWGGNKDSLMWRWLGWIQPAEDIKF